MLRIEDVKLHSENSESEKLGLRVAFSAAERIFPAPVYRHHNEESFYTFYDGGKNVKGLLIPLPEGAVISQLMLVSFRGGGENIADNLYDWVTVGLKGLAEGERIIWSVSSVSSPWMGGSSVFTKEEKAAFTRQV